MARDKTIELITKIWGKIISKVFDSGLVLGLSIGIIGSEFYFAVFYCLNKSQI
jgi:hypothetical protein